MEAERNNKIIEVIRGIPTLKGLTKDELELIAPLFTEKTFHVGDFIIVEETQGNTMYIISRGAVLVTKSDKTGEQVTLGVLRDGAFFGELSLFDNLPRSATVTAIEETSIFMLTRDDLDDLFSRELPIANKLYRNTLLEIFSRFRMRLSSFTFSQYHLREKNEMLIRINRDLSSAQEIQKYFINAESTQNICNDVKHSYIYQPSEAIGGDFINIITRDNRIYMIIADVQGHGITAALVTGVLKSAFVMLVNECGDDPKVFLSRLNNHLHEVINTIFATCYYAIIDTDNKKIVFAKAGHHHPFFWDCATGSFNVINSKGPGLGILTNPDYLVSEFDYNSGDKLLFFTDGIVEQRNAEGEMFSLKRLNRSFTAAIKNNSSRILESLIEDFHNFTGSTLHEDDITLLLYEF